MGTTPVAGVVTYSGTTATFTPTSSLTANTLYKATITTGAKNVAGTSLTKDYVWTFTTGAAPDTTAPTVTLTAPLNEATGIVLTSKVAITFSEAMDPNTISALTFTLSQGANVVLGAVTYTGVIATFTPTASLLPNKPYTATVTTGAKDMSGNALAANKVITFTTGAAPDTTLPTIVQNRHMRARTRSMQPR